MEHDLELVLDTDDDVPVPEAFVASTRVMFDMVATFLDGKGIVVPATKVVVTADLLAAIDREGRALGLGPDRREGLERVGGTVGGKCLRADDGHRATILLPLEVGLPDDGRSHLLAAGVVGHELGHLLYDSLREAEVCAIENIWLPLGGSRSRCLACRS